jgi:hypothetical protein
MIKIRGKTEASDPSNKIIFEPRQGFTRRAKTLEFPLVYGHKCPTCNNVMQALFKAPKSFSLWPYEETALLSSGENNSGQIRRIFPDEKTKPGKSCYRIDYSPAEGGSVKITLRNHIVRPVVIVERKFNGDGIWEVGYERPCVHAGVFSLREDLLIKDWLLFAQVNEFEVAKYKIPPAEQVIPDNNQYFKLVRSVGQAPPVILVDKQSFVYGFHYYAKPLMQSHLKVTK